jgi:hypothetical protein
MLDNGKEAYWHKDNRRSIFVWDHKLPVLATAAVKRKHVQLYYKCGRILKVQRCYENQFRHLKVKDVQSSPAGPTDQVKG